MGTTSGGKSDSMRSRLVKVLLVGPLSRLFLRADDFESGWTRDPFLDEN